MRNEWISFLKSQQANIDEYGHISFASSLDEARAVNDSSVVADLSPLGIIRVSGEDAADFLQGQFSNDIKLLDGLAQLSSYCNPKGRILASFWIFQNNDSFYMLLPADTLQATIKRLRMFVLMSKVTLEDVSEEYICIGLAGDNSEQVLQQQFGASPTEPRATVHHEQTTVICLPGKQPRYLVVGTSAEIQALWQASTQNCTAIGYQAWKLLDIEAGLPSVYSENVEAFVPQMLNLHAIDGISFKKGCYPGQEIVARMHYLGKLKRRMYRAHIDTKIAPEAGDEVFAVDSGSGQGTGRVVMASPTANGGFDVLVVVQVSSAEQNNVHWQSVDGPKLGFIELPYNVPLERES